MGSIEHSHDVAHETMVRAYDNWAGVRTLEYPGAWLRRMLLNLPADEGRRSTRR